MKVGKGGGRWGKEGKTSETARWFGASTGRLIELEGKGEVTMKTQTGKTRKGEHLHKDHRIGAANRSEKRLQPVKENYSTEARKGTRNEHSWAPPKTFTR